MNKIILTANAELEDKELRGIVGKIWRKVDTMNERTKAHTIQIRELEKKIKEFQK